MRLYALVGGLALTLAFSGCGDAEPPAGEPQAAAAPRITSLRQLERSLERAIAKVTKEDDFPARDIVVACDRYEKSHFNCWMTFATTVRGKCKLYVTVEKGTISDGVPALDKVYLDRPGLDADGVPRSNSTLEPCTRDDEKRTE